MAQGFSASRDLPLPLAVGNGGTGVTTSTGSGNNVLSTSPTLVTPSIGVATGTSFNGITGLAAQADQETASSTVLAVSPGRQQFHPSACKAWIKYTSVTATSITGSYNITSLTDNGTGDTNLTIATDFSGTTYAATYAQGLTSASALGNAYLVSFAAGVLRVISYNYAAAAIDASDCCVTMFGDQ